MGIRSHDSQILSRHWLNIISQSAEKNNLFTATRHDVQQLCLTPLFQR
jgi:hypothetical protein